jgi:hypothetical protein
MVGPRSAALTAVLLALSCRSSRCSDDAPECAAGHPGAAELAEQTRGMFLHAYHGYLAHGFPWDELRPVSCQPRRWDRRERGTIDDVLSGSALTLVDALDSLAVLGLKEEFFRAAQVVAREVSFERDVTVSVFESTIRSLGGLLSAHLLLSDGVLGASSWRYSGELLALAEDLGRRMLPAFETPTGIPFHRVNLARGVEASETTQTCTAAAGTLLVEFGLLSRLTGRPAYERAARRALLALWARRNPGTGLPGNTIAVDSGAWLSPFASTGAGIDSFFEYLAKAYVLLDEPGSRFYRAPAPGDGDLRAMFLDAMESVDRHLAFGPWQLDAHIADRRVRGFAVAALQAFWPGLQVLAGRERDAREGHAAFMRLWDHFSALPEQFDLLTRAVPPHARQYFLRPELAESTMLLFAATRDPQYLAAGARMLTDIERRCRTRCGYAALRDVTAPDNGDDNKEDRMDSFLLSETLKYLYMLFDMGARNSSEPTHLQQRGQKALFSTEGHLFLLPSESALGEPRLFAPGPRQRNRGDANAHANEQPRPPAASAASAAARDNDEAPVRATLAVETLLSAQIGTPAAAAQNNKQQQHQVASAEFMLAPARFGRELIHSAHFVMVHAEPRNACAELTNTAVLEATARASREMRIVGTGAPIGVALLVERGGCSFVHKAVKVANATKATVAMIVVNAEADQDAVYAMVDDGAARKHEELLANVAALMAPPSFAAQAAKALRRSAPDPLKQQLSSHVVLLLKPGRQAQQEGQPAAAQQQQQDTGLNADLIANLVQRVADSFDRIFVTQQQQQQQQRQRQQQQHG